MSSVNKGVLTTTIFILVILSAIIGFDIVMVITDEPNDTISEVFGKDWSWRFSTLPLAWGIITGHLFWIARGTIRWKWIRLAAMLAVVGASIVLDVIDPYDVVPIVPVMIGIPLGRLGWPQGYESDRSLFVWKK